MTDQQTINNTDVAETPIELLCRYLQEEIDRIHNARIDLHRKYPELLGEFNE